MWQIENHTPFGAQSAFVREKNGAEIWLVAVKASYEINNKDKLAIREPLEPKLAPEYMGVPGKSSLKYDSDLILLKPGTDVILHGHACAPGGTSVQKMDVGFKVGSIQKSLQVTGDRYWEKGLTGLRLSAPEPFEKIALVYENSYGGTDESVMKYDTAVFFPENPVGTGFAVKEKTLKGQKAPNITYIRKGKKRPAGFGPVPVDWAPRCEYGGRYDEAWSNNRAPLLPDDFDDRYFYCAPQDQQVPGHLKGGETVEIFGMTPRGNLKFKLPALNLTFQTIIDKTGYSHTAKLHTLILEPDVPGFSMVWHTSINCHNRDHLLKKTIIT